jgi:tRNA G26 N,N-dimethylase Trm1
MNEMEKLRDANKRFDLIDLDPFVSCRDQLVSVWPLLQSNSLLFITFGGEYRRSFIGSNRKAMEKRYGFTAFGMDNRQYLHEVPFYFIGWAAEQAAKNDCIVDLIRAVRYPNNCRFWTSVKKVSNVEAQQWLSQATVVTRHGRRWENIMIPRFREMRFELDEKTAQYQLAI